jgi:hypothetical protein
MGRGPAARRRRRYRGHAGVRESFEGWLEGFDEYSFEIEDVVDCPIQRADAAPTVACTSSASLTAQARRWIS